MRLKTASTMIALALSLAGGPVAAQTPPSEPAVAPASEFQVVRRGDGEMTCDALIDEINSLNTQVQAMQMQMTAIGSDLSRSSMAASRQSSGGGAMGLAGMAASFIPGVSMVSGGAQMLRQQAAQAAAQQQQQQIMDRTAELTESVTAMAPMANRAAHLSEIARDKSC